MNIFGTEFLPSVPNEVLYFFILGIIIIFVLKFLPKKHDYPRKDIDVEGPKEFADMMNVSGTKIMNNKFYLYNGPIKLGRIGAFSPIHYDSKLALAMNIKKGREARDLKDRMDELRLLAKQVQGVSVPEAEPMVDNFYLFEVIKDTPIHKILYMFGFGKNYHLVDQILTTPMYHEYNINLYARPIHFFKNVYVYSEMSKAVALNIADRLTVKQVLNGVINFVPKMDYIEMKTANYAAKAREYTDIKDKSWKKREENLEKEVDV